MTHLPNILTISRMALVAPFVGLYYLPDENAAAWATFGLFVLAAVTDFFDGQLARRMNRTSEFGRIFDPIADKLIVAAALVMLVVRSGHEDSVFLAMPYGLVIPVVAILCRELLISGLREGLAGRFSLPVSRLGKWKTASQMAAIVMILFAPALASFSDPEWSKGEGKGLVFLIFFFVIAGQILLWISAVLCWLSASVYLRAVARQWKAE